MAYTNSSAFAIKFCAKSPLKHAPKESHANRDNPQKDSKGNVHHHEKKEGRWHEIRIGHDQGKVHEEREPISQEEAEKLTSSGDPRHAALLEGINKNRREEGLPEFETLEEALR